MRALFLILVLVAAAGCDDDPTYPPTMADIAGTYTATRLEVTSGGSTMDMLAAGTELEITLLLNGTTEGRLFIPEGEDDGSDVEADLAGAWSVASWEVTFSHPADTFVRDMAFTWDDGTLRGDEMLGGERVVVVLTR